MWRQQLDIMTSAPEAPIPGMLGSDALMQFLQAGLQQLEADQGGEDDEARGLLQMLQQQTALMQALQGSVSGQQGGPALTDLQIAEQMDSLDAQLSQLEASLSSADASTMQLLGQSTSKWLNSSSDNSRQPIETDTQATSSGTDMDGNGSSSSSVALQAAGCSDTSSSQEGARQCDRQGSGSTSSTRASVQEAAAASAHEEPGSKADDPAVHTEACKAQDAAAATCATHVDGHHLHGVADG